MNDCKLCNILVVFSLSSVSGMSCGGTLGTCTHGTGKNYGIVATFVSSFDNKRMSAFSLPHPPPFQEILFNCTVCLVFFLNLLTFKELSFCAPVAIMLHTHPKK